MSTTLATQITTHLSTRSLHPTTRWLSSFLPTQKPTTPLPALKQTALFRLLASDIRSSLSQSTACFPNDVLDANVRERKLSAPVVAMVLDVEDVSCSRWSQVERLEEVERGEATKGREVVRVVAGEEGLDPGGESGGAGGMCKVLLCDAKGVRLWGFEVERVQGVSVGMMVGCKVLMKEGIVVARGVVLLEPRGVVVLGGKVEELAKVWREGRKARLIAGIEATEGG